MRSIANLDYTQKLLQRTQHVKTRTENITFEHWDVAATVRYMAKAHIFVSVHGAGMTNMFFMNPGSAVVEIIPYPLCNCRSPDYFYGVGGYYHGSAVAQNIRHYPYCVEAENMVWHKRPEKMAGEQVFVASPPRSRICYLRLAQICIPDAECGARPSPGRHHHPNQANHKHSSTC